MSKKETRRAARQAFPKAKTPAGAKTATGARARGSGGSRSRGTTRPAIKPPSLKRAAIQAAIVATLYLLVIRFVWRQEGSGWATYVFFPAAAFVMYTGIAYAIDKFTYERRLRRLKGSSK